MEYLPNGISLSIPDGCFPLSTDSMVLAHFAAGIGSRDVLDLGSGCATLGLLLCAGNDSCHVTGVELDEFAHRAAVENILRNDLEHRLKSICADVRQVPELFAAGSFPCCISNPPYFSGGPGSSAARREDTLPLASLLQAAGHALKYGGDFFLVHRPERLAQIIAEGARFQLEAKRLGLVRHREDGPVTLILLQLRKGGKPGLILDDWSLHGRDGKPTQRFQDIYHIREE